MPDKKIQDFKDIKEILYNCREEYNDKPAFVIKKGINNSVEYENISYYRLIDEINKLGTAYYSVGLKDKKIAVIGKNRYEWALAHLTSLLGGMVSVPLDKDLQIEELENSLVRSKVEAIVFDSKELEKIEKIKENKKEEENKIQKIEEKYDKYEINLALQEIWVLISRTNKYIDETTPWVLAKEENKEKLESCMYHLIENLRRIGIVLKPVMTETSENILRQLGIEEETTWESLKKYDGIRDAKVIEKGEPLFMRLDAKEEEEYIKEAMKKA